MSSRESSNSETPSADDVEMHIQHEAKTLPKKVQLDAEMICTTEDVPMIDHEAPDLDAMAAKQEAAPL